jgi:uncharacterized membrane protein
MAAQRAEIRPEKRAISTCHRSLQRMSIQDSSALCGQGPQPSYCPSSDLMGPKLFDLPILLALAYVGMGYLSWVLGLVILECQDKPLSGRKIVLLPLAASFIMTAWDLSMDPAWADIDHAWVWRDGGLYYGVPIRNFFGWFLTVYIFYQFSPCILETE